MTDQHARQPARALTPTLVDRRRGPLHYVWQTASWLLLIAAIGILCVTILVPKIAGAQTYTVLTGSMRPNYPPGTLIVVTPRAADQITKGDVVTYQIRSGEPAVITHRVIDVTRTDRGELRFITQGDANNVADELPVKPGQVRGVLWYSIPYLGYVNNWVTGKSRTVTIFVLAGLLFAYAAWQLYRGFRDDRKPGGDDEAPDDDRTANDDTIELPVVAKNVAEDDNT